MMSNFGGKNSAFEKDFRKRFTALNIRLTKAEDNITKVILSSLNNPSTSIKYWNTVKQEIDKIYKDMIIMFDKWAKKELPKRYKKSLSIIKKRIKHTRYVLNKNKRSLMELINSNASKQIVQALYYDAFESFTGATMAGRKNVMTFLHHTQQTLLNENLININVATGFEEGNIRKSITLLTQEFKSKLGDGAYLQAGKMKFKPAYYAQLVSRTKFHDAHSEATLMQAANYNTDLVQVSSHNTRTAICSQFEGKIYSISGKDLRFPVLQQTPPYHPNCLHLIMPTFESAMQVQGTLKAFSEFSLGKAETPPIPKGFLPLAKRKLA